MGGFLPNLAKGFIRSAVNQVGRDGGKVISNSIYGNAHAIPIRGIAINQENKYFDENSSEIITPEELRCRAEAEGFKTTVFKYKTSIKIIWYIISLFFCWLIFPSIILLIIGIKKIFQKHTYMRKEIMTAKYVSDRRCKTGNRLNGYSEETIEIKVPSNNVEKVSSIKAGFIYIILAILSLFAGKSIINVSEESRTLENYTKFIENAKSKKDMIELDLEVYKDSIKYQKDIEQFNKQYEEATQYIKTHTK